MGEGEGDDIGGLVDATVVAVEAAYGPIADYEQSELNWRGHASDGEGLLDDAPEPGLAEALPPGMVNMDAEVRDHDILTFSSSPNPSLQGRGA